MEFEEIFQTRRTSEPLHGLDPPLDIRGHAWAAMQMHMRWTTNSQGGRPVYTRGRHLRMVPRNTRRLARAYVDDKAYRTAFPSLDVYRLAKRAYCASLEVELENIAEQLLNMLWDPNIAVRGKALTYIGSLQRLGLMRNRNDPPEAAP